MFKGLTKLRFIMVYAETMVCPFFRVVGRFQTRDKDVVYTDMVYWLN